MLLSSRAVIMPMIFTGVSGAPSLDVSVAEGMLHCKTMRAERSTISAERGQD
jgi:hypothetical protein